MTHKHIWQICKKTGLLRHKCPDGEWEEREYEHGKEPFLLWSKAHLKPPVTPSKPRLDDKLTIGATGRFYSPFFLKGGLFLRPDLLHYTEKDFQDAIDYIAEHDLANNIRMFLWWVEHDEVVMPHPKINGKYSLQQEDGNTHINMKWWNQVYSRVKYITDRNIAPRLIFLDQSSLRHFDKHFINPDNNYGWDGKPLYGDRHGMTKWYWYADRPDRCTEEEARDYATTRDYLLALYDFIIPQLEPFKPIWETNEIDMGAKGHEEYAKILAGYGVPRERRITSPRGGEWLVTKPVIAQKWMPEVHGIRTLEAYNAVIEELAGIKKKLLLCGDGHGEDWLNVGANEIRALLMKILKSGNLGYTGNSEGKWDIMFKSDTEILKVAVKMRDTFKEWLNG